MGMSLPLDMATQNRVCSHYAGILADLDLSRNIFDEVMVERDDFAFNLEVVSKWLPDFCLHYKSIDQSVTEYCWLHLKKVIGQVDRGKKLEHVIRPTIHKYVEKVKDVGTSKTFEALADQNVVILISPPYLNVVMCPKDIRSSLQDQTMLCDRSLSLPFALDNVRDEVGNDSALVRQGSKEHILFILDPMAQQVNP